MRTKPVPTSWSVHRDFARWLGLLTCFTTAACDAPPAEQQPDLVQRDLDPGPPLPIVAPLPEVPAIARSTTGYESGAFVDPHVPPVRTSNDGRIGLHIKRKGTNREFVLLSPELLDDHFERQAPGIPLLSPDNPTTVDESAFHGLPAGSTGHMALCDGNTQFPAPGEVHNPIPCGDGNDCYALTAVTTVALPDSNERQLWGTPIEIEVSDPKTPQAAIVQVTTGAPVGGPTWEVGSVFEPMVSDDGHLLTMRIEGASLTWSDDDGTPHTGNYDIVYSPGDPTAAACDVTQWADLYPITHAPHHDGLGDRYGFAVHPFRDAEGNVIPDGDELKGTYPWVDRKGRNLFFTALSSTLHYTDALTGIDTTRYPTRCVPGVACTVNPTDPDERRAIEAGGRTRGVFTMGLWTQGKMVMLDGAFANTDYGLRQSDSSHREVQLYAPNSGVTGTESGWHRLGTGRDNSATQLPDGAVANTTFIDSLEHLFNYDPELFPGTPRDVVWTLNSGRASDEIAFDDYLDADVVVFADMNASMVFADPSYERNDYQMRYHDGFYDEADYLGRGFTLPVRLQNAASTREHAVAPAGRTWGNIRIEPSALGGIKGKGLWLDGASGFGFDLPEAITTNAYLGMFIDSRPLDDQDRRLVTFPNGDFIELRSSGRITYQMIEPERSFDVLLPPSIRPAPRAWTHLGFVFRKSGRVIDIYVDGFLFRSLDIPAHFPLSDGALQVGQPEGTSIPGTRGWFDEVKVIARRPDMESICNQARGTLVGFDADVGGAWGGLASVYPQQAHTMISHRLSFSGQPSFERYACVHDYDLDYGILAEPVPPGTTSVRTSLLFPEGPLQWNAPRPASDKNPFCLTCHRGDRVPALGKAALAGLLTPMVDDPRRQPMQAPRLMSGHVPADLFGPGSPAVDQSSSVGVPLDQWLFPEP